LALIVGCDHIKGSCQIFLLVDLFKPGDLFYKGIVMDKGGWEIEIISENVPGYFFFGNMGDTIAGDKKTDEYQCDERELFDRFH
jgi:hypothetical protein